MNAVLKVQLGPTSTPRPGAPEAHHQAVLTSSLASNAGVIIVDQAQYAARRGTWKKHKQAIHLIQSFNQLHRPPPASPPRRLVTVVREKTRSRSSFCQLDREDGGELVETATSSPLAFSPTPTFLASPYSCSPSTFSTPGPCPTPTTAVTPSVECLRILT